MNTINETILNHKVSIYVPSTINVDKQVDNTEQVNKALSFLCDSFGGASSYQVNGAWKSETGKIVIEPITVVFAYCSEERKDRYENDVMIFASVLKTEMSQEAVMIELDGTAVFI